MIIGVFISGFYVVSVLQHHGSSYSNHVHHFKSDFEPCLYFKPICLLFCLQFGMCTWFSIANQWGLAVDYIMVCDFLFLVMSEVLCGIMSSTSPQFYVTISHRALIVPLPVEDVHVVICNVCGSALVQHSFHARSDAFIQYTSYVNSIMLVSCVMRS